MATDESRRPNAEDGVEVRLLPRASLIDVIGEHDLSTRQQFSDAVAHACERPGVVVDLSQCTFIDSSILGVLFSAHAQCERLAVVLSDPGSIVHRAVALAGVRDVMPVYESPEDAFWSVAEPKRYASAIAAVRSTARAC